MPSVRQSTYQEEQTKRMIELARQLKAEGEAKSVYKRGQRVRVCTHTSFSFNQNPTSQEDVLVPTNPHDCNDPEQHFESRVVDWDSFGRIEVAIATRGGNPHCAEWCWTDDMLSPLTEGEDWVQTSQFKMGQELDFVWDDPCFSDQIGTRYKAKLISPHIEPGDWFVLYQRYPETDGWITCVVNERAMIPSS